MNAYQKINNMITDRMITRINETQELPWKKPWTSHSMMPRNLVTKNNYRGVSEARAITSPPGGALLCLHKLAQAMSGYG